MEVALRKPYRGEVVPIRELRTFDQQAVFVRTEIRLIA
jgi:hypothetical protein